jgi:hypothetical protein
VLIARVSGLHFVLYRFNHFDLGAGLSDFVQFSFQIFSLESIAFVDEFGKVVAGVFIEG